MCPAVSITHKTRPEGLSGGSEAATVPRHPQTADHWCGRRLLSPASRVRSLTTRLTTRRQGPPLTDVAHSPSQTSGMSAMSALGSCLPPPPHGVDTPLPVGTQSPTPLNRGIALLLRAAPPRPRACRTVLPAYALYSPQSVCATFDPCRVVRGLRLQCRPRGGGCGGVRT